MSKMRVKFFIYNQTKIKAYLYEEISDCEFSNCLSSFNSFDRSLSACKSNIKNKFYDKNIANGQRPWNTNIIKLKASEDYHIIEF